MAKMYPSEIDTNSEIPNSEKKIFKVLAKLPDDYHVIHSLKWWKSWNNQGECDFIIFHPDRGFIALEVKGGRITLDNFQWHSIDRNGCQHKIDNPISQVKNAMHAIIKIYQSKYGKFNGYFCWGVCFRDCIWDIKTDILETSKDNILDFGTPEDFYSDRLPLALLNLLENVKNDPYYYSLYRELNYDAVIIDEGQDFNKNWCDCIQLLFEKPRNRIFYAFFDENQNIFQKYKELPIIKLITSGNPNQHIFRLTDNLRNTSEIYNFAVNQTDLGRTAHPIVLTGLEPEIVTFNKSNRLFHYLSAQIDKLVKVHHIDNKKIVILSNRSFENSIFNSVESIGNYHLITSDKEVQNNSICFKTIHLYKGMESDIVFLVIHQRQEELERNTQYLSNELIYVGCTRAKHLLHVIYFNPIFAGCQ